MATRKNQNAEIDILTVHQGVMQVCLVGVTPIILNRLSQKAKRQLLLPSPRKSRSVQASTLKHDPIAEFRASSYLDRNPEGPTYLQFLGVAFKRAMAGAALDIPGAAKAQIGRLLWAVEERVAIYGVPKLHMSIVRQAGMKRTPDVRTRVIVPEWACSLTVRFAVPLIKEATVMNLLLAAGMTQGVGDWRPEKGSGSYGAFEPVEADDERWNFITANYGREVQIAAMQTPEPYDDETEELLSWFFDESDKRGFEPTPPVVDVH